MNIINLRNFNSLKSCLTEYKEFKKLFKEDKKIIVLLKY